MTPTATAFRTGLAEAWWAAPVAWALARAVVTAFPLEPLRQAAGRLSPTLGYLVTCVPCTSAWILAAGPALLVGLELGPWAAVACWAGAWGGALFLDAALDRLQGGSAGGPSAPLGRDVRCLTCDGDLAGVPEADVAAVVTAAPRSVRWAHRRCPGTRP